MFRCVVTVCFSLLCFCTASQSQTIFLFDIAFFLLWLLWSGLSVVYILYIYAFAYIVLFYGKPMLVVSQNVVNVLSHLVFPVFFSCCVVLRNYVLKCNVKIITVVVCRSFFLFRFFFFVSFFRSKLHVKMRVRKK